MTLEQELAKAVIDSHIVYTHLGDRHCAHCKAENWEDMFEARSRRVSHLDDCIVLKANQLLGEV